MNKILFLVAALSAFAALAEEKTSVTNAPASTTSVTNAVCGDKGLERLFDKAGLKFRFVENPGVYELTFPQDNGRTQLVIVDAKTEKIDDYAVREISSACYHGALTKELAMYLLDQNYKVGAWRRVGDMLVFSGKAPSHITSHDLETILRTVATTADELEALWTGKDEF